MRTARVLGHDPPTANTTHLTRTGPHSCRDSLPEYQESPDAAQTPRAETTGKIKTGARGRPAQCTARTERENLPADADRLTRSCSSTTSRSSSRPPRASAERGVHGVDLRAVGRRRGDRPHQTPTDPARLQHAPSRATTSARSSSATSSTRDLKIVIFSSEPRTYLISVTRRSAAPTATSRRTLRVTSSSASPSASRGRHAGQADKRSGLPPSPPPKELRSSVVQDPRFPHRGSCAYWGARFSRPLRQRASRLSGFRVISSACSRHGGVAEWLNALVLKTSRPARVSWVRIPPPPPRCASSSRRTRARPCLPLRSAAARVLFPLARPTDRCRRVRGELAESVEGARLLSE